MKLELLGGENPSQIMKCFGQTNALLTLIVHGPRPSSKGKTTRTQNNRTRLAVLATVLHYPNSY